MNRLNPSGPLPLRGWWRRLGGGGRFCAVLALVAVVVLALLLWLNGRGGGLDRDAAEYVIVMVVGVVWVMGVAVASGLPAWGYLVAGLWLGWHGVGLMGAWTGTPMAALPVGWWLLTGLAVLAWRGPVRKVIRSVLWLAMALGAGFFIAGPMGWGRLPGALGESILAGRLIVGTCLAVAGWWLMPRLRGWTWTEPHFGTVLAGGLMVMALGLGGSRWRDAGATAGWAVGAVETTGFLAALGWFWLGGWFAAGVVHALDSALTLLTKSPRQEVSRRWVWPTLWAGVTALEWAATHEFASGNLATGPAAKVMAWTRTWPEPFPAVLAAHGWVGIAVVVAGVGFFLQGRAGQVYLRKLSALWAAAWIALLAVAVALPGEQGVGEIAARSAWGAIAILAAGWMVWSAGMIGEDRLPAARGRPGKWGAMVILLGMGLAVEITRPGRWSGLGGEAALLGMVHLALPLVLCRWWRGGEGPEEGLPFNTAIWLSAAGLMGVVPLLHWNAAMVSSLALGPLLWLPVLLILKWRRPAMDMASGALAGAILGSAAVAGWCRPGLLLAEVPLFSWFNPPVMGLSAQEAMRRPFWNPAHFTLLLLMTGTGGLLGAIVFRGKSDPGVPLLPLLSDPVEAVPAPPAVP